MFYLYILYSFSSDKYYVSYSNDVERRLSEHNHSDRTTYTSKHRPWLLKKQLEIGNSRGFAMMIEKAIKKSKSRALIEKIILELVRTVFICAQFAHKLDKAECSI